MKNLYNKFLKSVALFQVRYPYITVIIILAITVMLYGGVSQVKTVASFEQMMPYDVSEVSSFNLLRNNYLGQDMIAASVEINRDSTDPNGIYDIRDKKVFEFVDHLKNLIESEQDIRKAYCASDIILYAAQKKGLKVNSISQLDDNTFNLIMHDELVKKQLSSYINSDYTISLIMATTDISADDSRMKLLAQRLIDDIDSVGSPSGLKVKLTGTPIIQQKLGELINVDRKNTQNISTFLVFIITMILFGTITSALVPITIVTLSVNWLYGIMGYANIPISTLAGGVAAMVIGIGIDYAIHLMNRFKYERKHGRSIEDAIVLAVQDTGTALTGAAIATTLAFLAFLLGRMPEMNRFGLLMGIGVSVSFILSIFGLPALLIIEENIIHFIKKNMVFGVDGEYVLYNQNDIHPDDYKVVDVSIDDLKTIKQKYKICTKKSKRKSKLKKKINNFKGEQR